MPSRTSQRLAETIRHRAAHVILHELKDPRMGFVTITRVTLADDLKSCTIHWSVLGEASQRSKTAHALDSAKGFVQRRIGDGLRLRSTPLVEFEYDESVEGAIKMGALLKQLRTDRGEPAEGESPDSPDPSGAADPPADEDEELDPKP